MEKNKNLEDFYYNLLHINGKREEEIISVIVTQNKNKFLNYTTDFEGLCKVVSNHIALDLDRNHIEYKIINTKESFAIFEHEFIVACYKNQNENIYVLIDPTIKQFMPKEGRKVRNLFYDYPGKILLENPKSKRLAIDLLEKGFTFVTQEELNLYINAFLNKNQSEITFDIETLFPEKKK